MGAIQMLFRTLQLYGVTLSLEMWDECVWEVTFPLLDTLSPLCARTRLHPHRRPMPPAPPSLMLT
jgi:hypothetical protein